MKKLSKLMALLLSLLMIASLFTACGDGKKDDDSKKEDSGESAKLTGEDLLIGDWELDATVGGIKLHMQLTFNEDGTTKSSFTEKDYNDMIEAYAELQADNAMFTKEDLIEMLKSQMPYESFSAQFDKSSGIWELDGDTLTFSLGTDAEALTAETKLSEGEKTITVESDGEIITLTKAK